MILTQTFDPIRDCLKRSHMGSEKDEKQIQTVVHFPWQKIKNMVLVYARLVGFAQQHNPSTKIGDGDPALHIFTSPIQLVSGG